MDLDNTIAAIMSTLADRATPHETIVPSGEPGRVSPPVGASLVMRGTLGEGGMAIVRLAEQVPLRRDVAVKTLRSAVETPDTAHRLVQEAWVTGALEHPNVVPVYTIETDSTGRPLIVLKRIEGRSWSALMHDAEAVRVAGFGADLLDWNLRVLIQICQALRFAHRKGIIHRDLKPENVMIGEFGEVYLLDWGIALALEDDGTGRFPIAKDAHVIAGTLSYMAPEMLDEVGGSLGTWTDVYLVGSTLFEILAGHAPHDAPTMNGVLHNILTSRPAPPPDTAPELGKIVRRAMHRDPSGRFESIDQIRLAIEGFLTHRGSRRIAERADAAAMALGTALARGDTDEAYAHFAECRFGYRAALEAWAQNDTARRALEQATRAMLEGELARGDADAASRLLNALEDPEDDLVARVEEAHGARREERARLARFEADSSEETGRRVRLGIAISLGSVWTLGPIATMANEAAQTLLALVATATATMFGAGIVFAWARRWMRPTRLNEGLLVLVFVTLGAQIVLAAGGLLAGWSFAAVHPLYPLLWCTTISTGVALFQRAAWPAAVGMALAFFAAIRWPEHRGWAMSAGNLTLLLTFLWTNRATRQAVAKEPAAPS